MTDQNQRNNQPVATNSAIASRSDPAPYLDHAQQDLLLAALNSQAPSQQNRLNDSGQLAQQTENQNPSSLQHLDNMTTNPLDPDFTPDMYDYDLDDSFDFDNADLGGQMIGGMPSVDNGEHHEKRKISDGDSDEGGDAKRQETQEGEKGSKKPGRKPLTNEPTTKRKAQNRAAQRAFRERKEKHLKDLETQVADLTKASEADKHENGLLRAQVDRLQVELKEYRKRLSLNSTAVSRSPPLSAIQSSSRNQMNFNFDFPKFGSLPSAQLLHNNSSNITPPLSNMSPTSASFGNQNGQVSRQGSEAHSMSPHTGSRSTRSPSQAANLSPAIDSYSNFALYSTNDNLHGFADALPQMGKTTADPLNELFSPSILKTFSQNQSQNGSYFNSMSNNTQQNNATSTNFDTSNGGDSTAGIPDHRVFRFNSNSAASNSASPSASSLSQWNHNATNSSCGTSPEPAVDSPATNPKPAETTVNKDPTTSQFSFTPTTTASVSNNDLNLTPFDSNSFHVPQLDTFDPVLFGDYRDTTTNILGGGDFNGGFFDDNFGTSNLDIGSPSNLFGILGNTPNTSHQPLAATTPSRSLMEEIDKARDGGDDDFGLPVANATVPPQLTHDAHDPKTGKLISCTSIWNQLQSNPDFQDGKFDLDSLCSELRTKARCSESGLMVDSDHVDAALKKVMKDGGPANQQMKLMFPENSWNNILSKMNTSKQA